METSLKRGTTSSAGYNWSLDSDTQLRGSCCVSVSYDVSPLMCLDRVRAKPPSIHEPGRTRSRSKLC